MPRRTLPLHSMAQASRWSDSIRFLGRALAQPRRIGPLAPSGPALARLMARLARGQTIVERGPGSGSITRRLIEALPDHGRFVAFQYGLRLLPEFKRHFHLVRVVGPVWRNLPPAYVILCRP